MTTALRLVADHDIYVTEPAATPRRVWLDDSEPVNWSALVSERAPSSGVRLRGATAMDLEGMR